MPLLQIQSYDILLDNDSYLYFAFMPSLTIEALCSEAATFSAAESRHPEPLLYGITDGKAVGTYLEQKFRLYLKGKYEFVEGNSASGIDFPGLLIDVKVTGSMSGLRAY